MTIIEWLGATTHQLQNSTTPRLDAEVLLNDAVGKNTAWLHAHHDAEIDSNTLVSLAKKVKRRLQNEPLAYIRGRQEFYGREFVVDARVLTPRPESEVMIELVLEHAKWDNPKIADIGTGSGALGITLALETNTVKPVLFIDIDSDALEVAKRNADTYDVDGEFLNESLLANLRDAELDIALANLPYVPNEYPINPAARHEPAIALFGGDDGLDYYREMFAQLGDMTHRVKLVATESLLTQHDALIDIANQYGFSRIAGRDLIVIFA